MLAVNAKTSANPRYEYPNAHARAQTQTHASTYASPAPPVSRQQPYQQQQQQQQGRQSASGSLGYEGVEPDRRRNKRRREDEDELEDGAAAARPSTSNSTSTAGGQASPTFHSSVWKASEYAQPQTQQAPRQSKSRKLAHTDSQDRTGQDPEGYRDADTQRTRHRTSTHAPPAPDFGLPDSPGHTERSADKARVSSRTVTGPSTDSTMLRAPLPPISTTAGTMQDYRQRQEMNVPPLPTPPGSYELREREYSYSRGQGYYESGYVGADTLPQTQSSAPRHKRRKDTHSEGAPSGSLGLYDEPSSTRSDFYNAPVALGQSYVRGREEEFAPGPSSRGDGSSSNTSPSSSRTPKRTAGLPVPRGSSALFRIQDYVPDVGDYTQSAPAATRRPRPERESRVDAVDQGGAGPVRTSKRHRSKRQGEQEAYYSDPARREKQRRSHSSSSPRAESETTYRMVTVFIDDKRDGRHYLTEIRVHVRPTHGGCWGNANEIATRLQAGPSRIDGPAKASVRRAHPEWGYVEHVFMRVPAVYNESGSGADMKSLVESGDHNIYIANERGHLTLTIFVEHDHSRTTTGTRAASSLAPPSPSDSAMDFDVQITALRAEQRRKAAAAGSQHDDVMPPMDLQGPPTPHSTRASAGGESPERMFMSPLDTQSMLEPEMEVDQHDTAPDRSLSNSPEPIVQQRPGSEPTSDRTLSAPVSAVRSRSGSEQVNEMGMDTDMETEMPPPTSSRPPAPAVVPAAVTAPVPAPAAAGPFNTLGAFGNAFAKYNRSTATSGFGRFASSSFGVPVPTPRPRGTSPVLPREKTEEEKKMENAVVEYIRGCLKKDPLWRVNSTYRDRDEPVKKQLEVYYWVEDKMQLFVGEVTPDGLNDAPGVTITKSHFMQAVDFVPEVEEELEAVLRLHELYGATGSRGTDPDALALFDVQPAITPALQLQAYLLKLRIAHAKWCKDHPGEDQGFA